MSKPIILTGLRSNSELHLGNYLGGILPMVAMQQNHSDTYQLNMFVPDLHSFTTPIDHSLLYNQTLQNLKVFAAAGLNLEQPQTYIYRQSYIKAHSEMAWILNCFTYFGELSRMNEFKEKSVNQDNISVGLFNYPVLMAADILLYGAEWVPVGEDQRQHLELTRDLAERINKKFGSILTVPKPWNQQLELTGITKGVRIRSLRRPDKKMSKSVDDPAGTIMLSDQPADAARKIMSATTDSLEKINYDWDKQPGVANLLQILSLLSNRAQTDVNEDWEGSGRYGDLKQAVAQVVESFLSAFQTKTSKINTSNLLDKLESDEQIMNTHANTTLLRIQKAVGLRPI